MELAQITAGQVVMLFLLMGTGMLLAAGDLGCIVRSKPVWKLAAVRTGGHPAITFSSPAFLCGAASGLPRIFYALLRQTQISICIDLVVFTRFRRVCGQFCQSFFILQWNFISSVRFCAGCSPVTSATFYRNATITHGFLRLDLLL